MDSKIAGSFYTDYEVRVIQERYMAEMKPLQDAMARVLMHARVVGCIITTSGEIEGMRYDKKTQEQIDIIKEHMQAVVDGYKRNFPGLFKYC